ncbi:MAG: phosphatase PAP2 family protein [Chloroflexi bacterium]|nr:phosphatase PAP2 family protein [Chloroflexota bacterium]
MVTAEIRTASRRKRRRLLLAAVVLTAAGLCVAAALAPSWETRTLPGDPAASQWFQSLGGGWLESFMRGASSIGGTVPMLLLLAAATMVLIARSHRAHALAVPIVAASTVLIPILKELVDRPRPTPDMVLVLSNVSGHSFPSGHAFMAITMFGALFYLAGQICGPNRWAVMAFRGAMGFAILAIGASRIYLGVHWTSDILGGYLLGGLTLFVTIQLLEAFARFLPTRPSGSPAVS